MSAGDFLTTYRGRRVLVTGHTGFKGAWLCAWLVRLGAKVTGFSDAPPTEPCHFTLLAPDMDDHRGDIADSKTVAAVVAQAQPEIVFHLAAQSLVRRAYDEPVATYQTNVMGTLTLFEALRAVGGVAAVVSATTDKVYRNREWVWGYREDDELGGSDPYSASKSCVELMTRSYCESFFRNTGPAVASVRAGNVIGGGDWAADRLIPDLIRAAFQSEIVSIRNPSATRPWQHVLDPLNGYLRAGAQMIAAQGPSWTAWNFGPRRPNGIAVSTIVEAMRTLLPDLTVEMDDTESARKESRLLALDSSKATQTLDWRPLWEDEMLTRTLDWHRAFHDHGALITDQQITDYERCLCGGL